MIKTRCNQVQVKPHAESNNIYCIHFFHFYQGLFFTTFEIHYAIRTNDIEATFCPTLGFAPLPNGARLMVPPCELLFIT